MDNNGLNDGLSNEIAWMRRMVAHNVRMPMAVIRGYGDVLRNNMLDEAGKQEAIDCICENIIYLDRVMNVIFDSTATDKTTSRVNLAECLKTVTGYVSEIAKKSGINIKLPTEDKEMYINADLMMITRIFYQLYENAFKYLIRGNTINFRIYSAGDEILLVYKDDGPGMEEDEVSHILDKGFRGKNSKNQAGSGLGLYDVNEIVKKHQGTMKVKSRKGYGFSAFITFPGSVKQEKGIG